MHKTTVKMHKTTENAQYSTTVKMHNTAKCTIQHNCDNTNKKQNKQKNFENTQHNCDNTQL